MSRTLLINIVVLATAACSEGPRTTSPTSPSALRRRLVSIEEL